MRRTASASAACRFVVCPRGSLTLSSASLCGGVGALAARALCVSCAVNGAKGSHLSAAPRPASTPPSEVSGPGSWPCAPCSRPASSSPLTPPVALRSAEEMAAAAGTAAEPLVAQQPRLSRVPRAAMP